MTTNEADTIWNPGGVTVGEYSLTGVLNIVDPSAVQLVDPSAVSIVDTGQTFSLIPSTIWVNSPGE